MVHQQIFEYFYTNNSWHTNDKGLDENIAIGAQTLKCLFFKISKHWNSPPASFWVNIFPGSLLLNQKCRYFWIPGKFWKWGFKNDSKS